MDIETEKCSTCKHPINQSGGFRYCSEFCSRVTDKEKTAFKAMLENPTEDAYGVWPCPMCGGPVEGEFDPQDCVCASCYPRLKNEAYKRVQAELLEALIHVGVQLEAAGGTTDAIYQKAVGFGSCHIDGLITQYGLGKVRT